MNSNFLKLNWLEVLKGFIVAIFGALLTGVYQALQTGTINFTWLFWKPIVITGVGAGLAYLIKTLFQNSGGVPFNMDKPA